MSSEINQLDLAMKMQGALLRKAMNQQSQKILKLVRSVTEDNPQSPRGRDDRLGKITDVTA